MSVVVKRIDLKVGFACNNFCKFCVQGDKREKLPAKSLTDLVDSLREGIKVGANEVVLTGGEPSLHPQILPLVRRAKDFGYRTIQLQSNGRSLCYVERVRALAAAGVNEFGPSLHGSCPKIHDFLTGAPGSFIQTVAGIRNVKRIGLRVITNTVITKANYRNLPEIASLLISLGVEQYQFAFMHVTGRAAVNKGWLTVRKSIAEPWVKLGLDVGLRAGARVMTEAIPYCFMSGYESCIAERVIPSTRIVDAESTTEDYTHLRRTEGKSKDPPCVKCVFSSECEGPWREYTDIFG